MSKHSFFLVLHQLRSSHPVPSTKQRTWHAKHQGVYTPIVGRTTCVYNGIKGSLYSLQYHGYAYFSSLTVSMVKDRRVGRREVIDDEDELGENELARRAVIGFRAGTAPMPAITAGCAAHAAAVFETEPRRERPS